MSVFNLPEMVEPQAFLHKKLESASLWLLADQGLFEKEGLNTEDALLAIKSGLMFYFTAEDTPLETIWKTAPLICEVKAEQFESIIHAYLNDFAQKSQAIFLWAPKETRGNELHAHIGHLLMVKIQAARAWFRFWDPNSLRGLLTGLSKNEQKQADLLGPFSGCLWFEPAPYNERFYKVEKANAQSKPFPFGEYQVDESLSEHLKAFQEWQYQKRLFAQYQPQLAELDAKKTAQETFDWLYQGIKKLNYQTSEGFLDLFKLALDYGQTPLNQSDVLQILKDESALEYIRVKQARQLLDMQKQETQ